MKRLAIVLVMVLGMSSSVQAVKWDTQTNKAFRNADSYALFVDFSDAKIDGLDSADFVSYYCGKEKKKANFLDFTYKKFRYELASHIQNRLYKTIKVNDNSPEFVLEYKILYLTEKAGITGELYVYPKDQPDKAQVYDFKLKEGRWNSFDVLLLEAAEKMGKYITDIRRTSSSNYIDDLYVFRKK